MLTPLLVVVRSRQALHYAAGAANLPVMEALLKHGANVNGGTNNKTTALALCSMSGNEEAVRLLVRYGAEYVHKCWCCLMPVW